MLARDAPAQRVPLPVAVAGAVAVGALTATQSRINSDLAGRIDDGYLAALISFGSGLGILLVLLAASRRGRAGVARVVRSVRVGATPVWFLLGGLAGALFVLSQGLSGAVLGVALFTIASVCGQTVSGMIVDRVGIGAMVPAPITVTRLTGSLLALVAVAWAVSAQLRDDVPAWVLVLPLVAGVGLAWQQAANGQVRMVAGSALTATVVNFVAGTVALAIAAAVHLVVAGAPSAFPTEPWLYAGGAVGACFIGLAAVVVARTGVLLLGLGAIAGQLTTSLVLDLVLPVADRPLAPSTVIGTALALAAVAVAALPSGPLRRRPAPAPR